MAIAVSIDILDVEIESRHGQIRSVLPQVFSGLAIV
jgi:hypothetical protein